MVVSLEVVERENCTNPFEMVAGFIVTHKSVIVSPSLMVSWTTFNDTGMTASNKM